jgi:hypothetical protein
MISTSNFYLTLGIIVCAAVLILFLDRLIIRRSKLRNQIGLCAKCAEKVTSSSPTLAVGGGEGSTVRALVCDECLRKNVSVEKFVFLFLVILFVGVVLFLWLLN